MAEDMMKEVARFKVFYTCKPDGQEHFGYLANATFNPPHVSKVH